MTARKVAVCCAAVCVAAMLGGGTPLASAPHHRCALDGTVITANPVAVVYRQGAADSYDVFACVQRTGESRKLGAFDVTDGGVFGFKLGGKYVAYITSQCSHAADCVGRPHVRDLTTGKVRNASRTPDEGADVRPLARPSGAMAWIRLRPHSSINEVRTLDSTGERVLDASSAIPPTSLALAGRTLYWLHGDAPRAHTFE
jgi:hypothetical protein